MVTTKVNCEATQEASTQQNNNTHARVRVEKKLRIDLVNVPASNWIMIEKVKGKQESLSFCVNHHDRGAERLK